MPPNLSSGLAQPPYRCTHPGCKAKYQRKEHLNRHLAHHSKGSGFSCPYCESNLTRSDLLRRHVRIYHPDKEAPSSRIQKACRTCHARKERCTGGFPCSACRRRGSTCSPATGESQEKRAVDKNVQMMQRPPLLEQGADVSQSRSPISTTIKPPRWVAHDYVDIYFRDFHPKWPFLHRGTFDLTSEPCVLIQSVAMIGLWMEGSAKSEEAAEDFHHSLCAAIRSQMDRWQISDQTPRSSWPMPTYQSILLQSIFAVFKAAKRGALDLNFRYQLEADEYELLVALVRSCRLGGVFSYPNMITQHSATAPPPLVWVSVEEIKRFGLALYKVCRICTYASSTDGDELLSLADLHFGLPDSDEAWNCPPGTGTEVLQKIASQSKLRDNLDPAGWISQSSSVLYDARIGFDWI